MQPVIFLHIPKTAGTTLRNLAYRNYRVDKVHESYDESLWFDGVDVELEGTDWELIFGHVRYGYHTYLSKPYAYATMLRNPVERVYSHYRHFLRSDEAYHKAHAEAFTTFEAFCSSPSAYNIQTRMLSGVYDYQEFVDREAELLDVAKKHLDGMLAVGLSERFDDSLLLFREKLGWKILRYVRQNEDERSRKELSAAEKEAAIGANKMDAILYEHAEGIFAKAMNDIKFYKLKKMRFDKELKLAALKSKYMP